MCLYFFWILPILKARAKLLKNIIQFLEELKGKKDCFWNFPIFKALSDCSPWFHTGQLSVQRSVLQVRRSAGTYEAKGKIFLLKKNVAIYKYVSKNSELFSFFFSIFFRYCCALYGYGWGWGRFWGRVCEKMSCE